MSDKKDQKLNLPTTSIPMKANLNIREPEMLKEWDERQVYKKIRSKREGREKFLLHDGPPYANGNTHLGHAVNKVLKDIIIKKNSMITCRYSNWFINRMIINKFHASKSLSLCLLFKIK